MSKKENAPLTTTIGYSLHLLLMITVLVTENSGLTAPAVPPSSQLCLQRPANKVITSSGNQESQYRVPNPGDEVTFDLRNWSSTAYPQNTLYPLSLGNAELNRGLCVIGGTVLGQLDRNLGWNEVKGNYDGDGLRIAGQSWFYVDGLRVDNVEDGLSPRGPQDPSTRPTLYAKNLYFTFIHDDCIENDACLPGVIEDSLFDGCYMGISERPGKGRGCPDSARGHTFTMDGVLMRLQRMPRADGSGGDAHGHFFKWTGRNEPDSNAGTLIIRNSILLAEEVSYAGPNAMEFPTNTIAENVILVWLGQGRYPAKLPPGVRVTNDISVWNNAKANWLNRHGY